MSEDKKEGQPAEPESRRGVVLGVLLALAAVATLIATVNIFGGFWVTQRMLKMFRR